MKKIFGALLLSLTVTACPHPGPNPGEPGKIVKCGTTAIQTCASEVLPAVNECLAGVSDVTSCLLGLIKPTSCLSYEVIACLVRHEGAAAHEAAALNPRDIVDAQRAARSEEFLAKQSVKFED